MVGYVVGDPSLVWLSVAVLQRHCVEHHQGVVLGERGKDLQGLTVPVVSVEHERSVVQVVGDGCVADRVHDASVGQLVVES